MKNSLILLLLTGLIMANINIPQPDFETYAQQAQSYLDRPVFKGTSLTGQMLARGAKQIYDTYGILLPVEFALAQAQKESSMGRKGRSPVNNPFNVGEFDEGTKLNFNTPQEGINAYYDLMARRYLGGGKTTEDLMQNFVNDLGQRYATDKGYEQYFQEQVPYIQRFFARQQQNTPLFGGQPLEVSFDDAFASARKQGLKEFIWQGKRYNTKLK